MNIKTKQTGTNQYVVNGTIVKAKSYKDALSNYIAISMSGAKIIIPKG